MSTYCALSVAHDLPVAEGAASGIEVDAYLDYREAGEGELCGVVLKTADIHPPKTGISVHFSCSLS